MGRRVVSMTAVLRDLSRESCPVCGERSPLFFSIVKLKDEQAGRAEQDQTHLLGSWIIDLFLGSSQASFKPLLVFRFLLLSGNFLPLDLVFDEGRSYPWCHVNTEKKDIAYIHTVHSVIT